MDGNQKLKMLPEDVGVWGWSGVKRSWNSFDMHHICYIDSALLSSVGGLDFISTETDA